MIRNSHNRLPLPTLPVRVLSPALREAARLLAAGVPVEQWSSDALTAFCEDTPLPLRQWLAALSDQELSDYAIGRLSAADMPAELRALVRAV